MKIKVDENLPTELADLLASFGHDVHTVPQENLAGQNDAAILDAATLESRILFTQDLDFSDVRKLKPGHHSGIVLLRLKHPSRRRLVERVHQILRTHSIEEWNRCFVVISDIKLRVRKP